MAFSPSEPYLGDSVMNDIVEALMSERDQRVPVRNAQCKENALGPKKNNESSEIRHERQITNR